MNRRSFVVSSAAIALSRVLYAERCALIAPGVAGCRSEISMNQIALASTLQRCPMWCWAASVVAVFKFFDHTVQQEAVVLKTYGRIACVGAQQPIQIAQSLSRRWVDDEGDDFQLSITAAYDPQSGVSAINNAVIVNELDNGRPLLYCNTHHAMVVCAADYRPTPVGPLIDGIGVMDPWPTSPRLHPLTRAEMTPVHMGGQMTFLASVELT